jgi:hypothetical protein
MPMPMPWPHVRTTYLAITAWSREPSHKHSSACSLADSDAPTIFDKIISKQVRI